jgi:hypothetical protein
MSRRNLYRLGAILFVGGERIRLGVQRVRVDPQVTCDLSDRLAGLSDDAHRTGPELRVEPARSVSHDLIISLGSGLHATRETPVDRMRRWILRE